MTIKTSDSLEFLKTISDYANDIVFADPPYALGSEIIIRPDGKVDYKKAVDFMNKWEMPTGEYWEQWFKETYRTLKHGGYLILYGMDRQLLLFKYYAALAGFQEKQSLYWMSISSFPKAADLSKMISKTLGEEREIIGTRTDGAGNKQGFTHGDNRTDKALGIFAGGSSINVTKSNTELGSKYEGYKYSIAPLKQTNETILVFSKPTKTGSPLHDVLAMEQGDDTITCSALNIDGNRVPFNSNETDSRVGTDIKRGDSKGLGDNKSMWGGNDGINKVGVQMYKDGGRYPAQVFVDSGAAQTLDEQSGETVGNGHWPDVKVSGYGEFGGGKSEYFGTGEKDKAVGGASKILHKTDFGPVDFNITPQEFEDNAVYDEEETELKLFYFDDEKEDPKVNVQATLEKLLAKKEYPFDLYMYQPKVSGSERNIGLAGQPLKPFESDVPIPQRDERPFNPTFNNHSTLKPIELNYRLLSLFKTPNPQMICYPFAGAGSEIIGGLKAGYYNYTACELNPEYVAIAHARIKFFKQYYK